MKLFGSRSIVETVREGERTNGTLPLVSEDEDLNQRNFISSPIGALYIYNHPPSTPLLASSWLLIALAKTSVARPGQLTTLGCPEAEYHAHWLKTATPFLTRQVIYTA